MPRFRTLKRRSEFLRVRGGQRYASAAFVLEAKPRLVAGKADDAAPGARFGFTVTKQLGSAVVRNRIRRRLKAIVAELIAAGSLPDAARDRDFVVVARDRIEASAYDELKREMARALERVSRPAATKSSLKG